MPTWLESLKAWNAQKGGKYLIPKKGTPEYDAVREMMGGDVLKGGDVAKPAPQNKKVLAKWMKPKKDDKPSPPKEPSAPSKLKIAVSRGIREMAVEKAILKYKEKHWSERFFYNLTPIKLNYHEYGHLKTGKLFYVLKNPERFIDRGGEFWLLNVFELAEVKEEDYEVSPGNTADGVNKLIAVDVGSVSWSSNLHYYLSGNIIDDRHHQGEIDQFADTGTGFVNIPLTSKYVPKTYREKVVDKMSKEYLNTTFPKGKDVRGKIITTQKETKTDEMMKKFNHPIAVAQRKKAEDKYKAQQEVEKAKRQAEVERYMNRRRMRTNSWVAEAEEAMKKIAPPKQEKEESDYLKTHRADAKLTLSALLADAFYHDSDKRTYIPIVISGDVRYGSPADKIIRKKNIFTNEQKVAIMSYMTEDDAEWMMKTYKEKPDYLLRESWPRIEVIDKRIDLMMERWIKTNAKKN